MKGKFAGSAIAFKVKAAIELVTDQDAEILSPTEIKTLLKHNPLPVPFAKTRLKAFQEIAFTTAFAYLKRKSS